MGITGLQLLSLKGSKTTDLCCQSKFTSRRNRRTSVGRFWWPAVFPRSHPFTIMPKSSQWEQPQNL